MKNMIIRAILSATLSVVVISSCAYNTVDNIQITEQTHPVAKPAKMEEIFNEDWDSDVLGEFDASVTFGDKEYNITSTALNFAEFTASLDYEIAINDASVIYNSGDYYNIEYAYLADINPDDDSVILFISPTWENGLQNMTAYKYSPTSGIVQLNFDFDGDGVTEPTLEPWRHCYNFEISEDGTFGLITGTRSCGMWGLQRYFHLDNNDVLVFEQQDKYQVKGWADGVNMMHTYDKGTTEPRTMTFDEAKANTMYCIESEQDYEMLLQGYYHCKQSCDDLHEGDFFKFVYDDNNGNVMFVTSEGREGWINVDAIGNDQATRGRIGGFALMLAG